nr:adenine phosphoribosyltransferase [Spelaeicoccus albus]
MSELVTVPDFPEPGIRFRDLTPAFANPHAFRVIVDTLTAKCGAIDAVAGVEARGFLLAAAAAYATDTSLLAIRKKGKLPGSVLTESYDLEYGNDALEISPDHAPPGTRVLLVDDVLATGGTLAAAARLLTRAEYVVAGVGVVLELAELNGRSALPGQDIHAILTL